MDPGVLKKRDMLKKDRPTGWAADPRFWRSAQVPSMPRLILSQRGQKKEGRGGSRQLRGGLHFEVHPVYYCLDRPVSNDGWAAMCLGGIGANGSS